MVGAVRFLEFLGGADRTRGRTRARAGGDTKSEPVYLEGMEGKGSDRAGRRQGRKLLARSRCNRSGGRGRRTDGQTTDGPKLRHCRRGR